MQLMKDLYQLVENAVQLYCDNQSAIHLTEDLVFHARIKHVEVHYHFVREKVLRGEINMKYVRTEDQVADIFTKRVSGVKFEHFRRQLGMVSKHIFLKGSIKKFTDLLFPHLSRIN